MALASDRDRLILASISGVSSRHCPLQGRYPAGEAQAIADVAEAARGRADLLAQYAGECLGRAAVHDIDAFARQNLEQATLCALAGADMDRVAAWIPVGLQRYEAARASQVRH